MSLAALKKQYQGVILDGMARALWIDAYVRWVDEAAVCRWCERSIENNDEGWFDDSGSGECPESDEGHEPDDDRAPASGGDWDDVAPETPDAAYMAAHDLNKLIAASEGMRSEKLALVDLFELAMNVHLGEWGFDELDERVGSPIGKQKKNAEHAYDFGFTVAMEALGTGVAWGDDHKTRRDGAVFEPKLPRFEVHYDGEEMTWSGRADVQGADRTGGNVRSGQQEARYVSQDTTTQYRKIGKITVVNPGDHAFYKHSYVIAVGAYGESLYLAWANSVQDALDEIVDWAEDNAPGLLADEYVQDEYNRLIAEGKSEEAAREESEVDMTPAGNHGHWINSSEWHILAEDPDREQLFDIAGVAQNPAPGDEWGEGGAEAYEQAEIVRDAIDPQGPLAVYEPEVFSTMSPEGRDEIADYREDSPKPGLVHDPGGVFIVLHPKRAAKALEPMTQAEWGVSFAGNFITVHVKNLLDNLVQHLNHKWPIPNGRWTTKAWGWGYMALTEANERTPAGRAVFLIGVSVDPARQNPTGLTAKGKRLYQKIRDGYTEVGKQRAKDLAERTVLARAKTTKGIVKSSSPRRRARARKRGR